MRDWTTWNATELYSPWKASSQQPAILPNASIACMADSAGVTNLRRERKCEKGENDCSGYRRHTRCGIAAQTWWSARESECIQHRPKHRENSSHAKAGLEIEKSRAQHALTRRGCTEGA